MEEYFEINPYPETEMKKEISEKTGLSDREITVSLNNWNSTVFLKLNEMSRLGSTIKGVEDASS